LVTLYEDTENNVLWHPEQEGSLKAVIKLGGFVFPDRPKKPLVREYVKLLADLVSEHHLVVVTGGGKTARTYINTAREMGVSEALCDHLGILVSRLNARLLVDGLGEYAFPEIPVTIGELKHYFASGKIVAMGGLSPGHSTNAVAAIAAETIGAELLVNATNVDGVYSSDPSKHKGARKLDRVTVTQLTAILSKTKMMAGAYELMDPLALRIIERSRLRAVVLNGRNPTNVTKALHNDRIGTQIVHG
jgi:uridylate kinase